MFIVAFEDEGVGHSQIRELDGSCVVALFPDPHAERVSRVGLGTRLVV